MVPCLCLSLQEVTRQWSLSQQGTRNIIQFTCHLATFPMLLGEHMEIHCFWLHSFPSQRVSFWWHSEFHLNFCFVASKQQWNKLLYQKFCQQLYHACLAWVFCPLKAGMTVPEVVKCPDGHFCQAVYGLGPYIADYPEQVWLSGIIQGWCPEYVMFLLWIFSLTICFKMPCKASLSWWCQCIPPNTWKNWFSD